MIKLWIEHSLWCPTDVASEQALVDITEVTQQQCGVFFRRYPTNSLTSSSVDLSQQGRNG